MMIKKGHEILSLLYHVNRLYKPITYMMSVKILGYCSIMITYICKRTPSQDVPAGTLMEALCLPWTLTQESVHDTVCLAELFTMRGNFPKDV
jgi:hypothetical protein